MALCISDGCTLILTGNKMRCRSHDRQARRERINARREKGRQAALKYLGGQCARCKSTDDLEFDHTDASLKSYRVSTRFSLPFEILREELDKCQLLCVDCHRLKTREDLLKRTGAPRVSVGVEHGMPSTYTNHKCRCDLCRISWNAYQVKFRNKTLQKSLL